MRTNIHLDDRLVRRVARLKEQEKIRRFRGKLRWLGDLGKSREIVPRQKRARPRISRKR